MIDNNYIKKAYKYDFFIQMDLIALNGLALKSLLNEDKTKDFDKKIKNPIANVFFKLSHRDADGMILTNKNEKKVVKSIHGTIKKMMES